MLVDVLIVLLIVLVVLAIIGIMAVMIGHAVMQIVDGLNASTKEERATPVTSVGWGGELSNVEHDGHKFVILSGEAGVRPVDLEHHPDCPCMTLAEIE